MRVGVISIAWCLGPRIRGRAGWDDDEHEHRAYSVTNYTDIVAFYTDQLAAETLANCISSLGVGCDVVDLIGPKQPGEYGVRVSRDRIAELRTLLKLTALASGLKYYAAQLLAGRLAREDIACYIGGGHTFGGFGCNLQLDVQTTLKETTEPGYVVAVPESQHSAAMSVLNEPPLSDGELAELALNTPPDPDDPP